MSDMRDLLERKAARFPRSEHAFDRVADRMGRRQRNRRIGAATLALVIASVGTVGALRAFDGATPGQIGARPELFHALWPETDYHQALAAQARVEAGRDAWRLDPERTARAFAKAILEPDVEVYPCVAIDPCVSNEELAQERAWSYQVVDSCDGGECRGHYYVRVERLLPGSTSIWSVTKVEGSVSLPFEPGDEVGLSGLHEAMGSVDPGTRLHIAYSYGDGRCGASVRGDTEFVENQTAPIAFTPASLSCPNDAEGHAVTGPLGGHIIIWGSPRPLDDTAPIPVLEGSRVEAGGSPGQLFAVPVTFVPTVADETIDPIPISPSPELARGFAAWPEHTAEAAANVQVLADAGSPDVQWRLDLDQVVRRFVDEVMGREVARLGYEPGHGGDWSAFFTDDLGGQHLVGINQPVRPGDGGIWSVMSASPGEEDPLRITSLSIGYDHDRITGRATPRSVVQVDIAYGSEDGEPTFTFEVVADENGEFSTDLRSEYGGPLPVPRETGWVLVREEHPDGGYRAVVARQLPAGSYSFG